MSEKQWLDRRGLCSLGSRNTSSSTVTTAMRFFTQQPAPYFYPKKLHVAATKQQCEIYALYTYGQSRPTLANPASGERDRQAHANAGTLLHPLLQILLLAHQRFANQSSPVLSISHFDVGRTKSLGTILFAASRPLTFQAIALARDVQNVRLAFCEQL